MFIFAVSSVERFIAEETNVARFFVEYLIYVGFFVVEFIIGRSIV